jgi:hypothetical protein
MQTPSSLPSPSCLSDAFRAVNAVLEPLVRAGLGSPWLWPTGLIVVETRGPVTGRALSVPLVATRLGDLLVASTVRPDAHWVRNLASRPSAQVWLCGRPRDVIATVLRPGAPAPDPAAIPESSRALTAMLAPWAERVGLSFAIFSPRDSS